MRYLDLQVIDQALQWARSGEDIWLCTVLATFGSSPREPGAMLVARRDGGHLGSLSGGCVEEDFLARLRDGMFDAPRTLLRYGDPEQPGAPQVALPCGGILEVLIERLAPTAATLVHLEVIQATLAGRQPLVRCIDGAERALRFERDSGLGPRIERLNGGADEIGRIKVRIGPAARLIIAGISPVSEACAGFARALGFEVIICDPREEMRAGFQVDGVEVQAVLPSSFIASGACHAATAVVALTHDPRIDDLAMIEAVRTEAFYIGVMGSQRSSELRAVRLKRSGGLSSAELTRIHMPIGLALGSKTPAEIALAVVADIVRVQRGRARDAL